LETVNLSVVVYEDGDLWVAQAIEFDIAVRADKPSKLPRAFERAVVANLAINHELGKNALEGIPPAPSEFRELFERASLTITERAERPTISNGVRIGDMRLAEVA
jgi:hypothetical protein